VPIYYLNMLMRSWIDDNVDTSSKGSMPKQVDLFKGSAVRVHDPLPLHEGSPFKTVFAQLLKESVVEVRSMYLHVVLLRGLLSEIEARIL
jgi:hypothetical protein